MRISRVFRLFAAGLAALGAQAAAADASCGGENILAAVAPTSDALDEIRAAAAAHPNPEGVFWRVERDGAAPSYLFGTYHVAAPEVMTPPEEVVEALRGARLLFVEVTPEEKAKMQSALAADPARFLDMTGGALDDFLSPSQIEAAERVFGEYGLPWSTARVMKPWFLQVMMALPPCEIVAQAQGAEVLDMRLAAEAKAAGVPVRGLETWEAAIEIFEAAPVEDQRRGLALALSVERRAEDMRRTAIDLYRAGEIMMIWEFNRAVTRRVVGEDPFVEQMEREFWDRAVDDRNRNFVEAAEAEFAKGGVMLAAGALHLPARNGLIELLRARGYTVTRLD